VTRVAVEIARALPNLAGAHGNELHNLAEGWTSNVPPLSRGEQIAVRWARITEELLIECDAETVDALLEVVDRLRAGMAR